MTLRFSPKWKWILLYLWWPLPADAKVPLFLLGTKVGRFGTFIFCWYLQVKHATQLPSHILDLDAVLRVIHIHFNLAGKFVLDVFFWSHHPITALNRAFTLYVCKHVAEMLFTYPALEESCLCSPGNCFSEATPCCPCHPIHPSTYSKPCNIFHVPLSWRDHQLNV